MANKKQGLGRGLSDLGVSELLGASPVATSTAVAEHDIAPKQSIEFDQVQSNYLPVDSIRPGRFQPRTHFKQEALDELAQSIKSQGIIQPIVVRRMNDGYEIIAGERRWRAAQLAGLNKIPVLVRDLPDEAVLAMSLIENIQRQDLNVLEEANALYRLLNEFNLTHQEVAEAVGKSRTNVSNILRLLKLNIDVKHLLETGLIEMGHARALLALEGIQQSDMAQRIVSKKLSVRQTEQLIRDVLKPHAAMAKSEPAHDPNVTHLQKNLSETLGAPVAIKHQNSGKGQLIIHYHSLEELDGILEHIK